MPAQLVVDRIAAQAGEDSRASVELRLGDFEAEVGGADAPERGVVEPGLHE